MKTDVRTGPSRPSLPALAVTRATLTRMVRDRTSLFFVLLLPIAIIIVIGATVTDFDRFRVGIVPAHSGTIAAELAGVLEHDSRLEGHRYDDQGPARTALRRSELDAVVLIPAGLDAAVRQGRPVTVPVLVEPRGNTGYAAVSSVAAALSQHAGRLQAARFAAAETGGGFDRRLVTARAQEKALTPIGVTAETAGGSSQFLPLGYSYSTPTMLVLFVFINSLAFGSAIVRTRRLGVYTRALASPVGARALVLGETLAYAALALVQSLLIVGIGALFFNVSWGDPSAAVLLVAVWALVSTGAGVLSGALFRTPEQAGALGAALGIGLGMLGGCMWPLAVVPDWLRTAGHAVPHAWAVDSWTVLLSQHGGLLDILGRLAVLAGFAVVLLTLAGTVLRRRLTG
ncbi:ABC transporter permease [Streptomyces sp. NPDC003077]|uniref:ABC transporter permease n=1 Tax=Streptomyces sp. NPDC003077 TaxID=3154443 RepID=UPI0033B28EC6